MGNCDGKCEDCQCGNQVVADEDTEHTYPPYGGDFLDKELITLFKPHVEAVFRPIWEEEIAKDMLIYEGDDKEDAYQALLATIPDSIAIETRFIVQRWVKMLLSVDIDQGLDITNLNDAMLPFNATEMSAVERFSEEEKNTISILRKVRASLPNGKVLPDQMVEILRLARLITH